MLLLQRQDRLPAPGALPSLGEGDEAYSKDGLLWPKLPKRCVHENHLGRMGGGNGLMSLNSVELCKV